MKLFVALTQEQAAVVEARAELTPIDVGRNGYGSSLVLSGDIVGAVQDALITRRGAHGAMDDTPWYIMEFTLSETDAFHLIEKGVLVRKRDLSGWRWCSERGLPFGELGLALQWSACTYPAMGVKAWAEMKLTKHFDMYENQYCTQCGGGPTAVWRAPT